MSEPLIALQDIHFAYAPDRPLFNGLSFDLAAGDRVALTGANGAGKTTLLEMMIGLKQPIAGSIHVFGRSRQREADFIEVRQRVGLVFEDPDDQLFCATVEEDIAFGPFNLGWSRDRVQQAVRDTLQLVGLANFGQRITYHLSRGEKRLVAIASVLAMQPEVLLLDEPTVGLDEDRVEALLQLLNRRDGALVVVSHDADFRDRVTSRTVTLLDGGSRTVFGSGFSAG